MLWNCGYAGKMSRMIHMVFILVSAIGFGGILALPAVGFTPSSFQPANSGVMANRLIPVGQSAKFPTYTLTDSADKPTDITAFEGEVMIVTFWATWCHVCEKEMPKLNAMAHRLGDNGIRIRPISVDRVTTTTARIAAYNRRQGLDALPILRDAEMVVWQRIGGRGTPTTLFVDKFSQVVGAITGGGVDWQDTGLLAWLDALTKVETAEQSWQLLPTR